MSATLLVPILFSAEPKRILVVGGTAAFRHPSIPNGEKMLQELAARSNGEFTVTLMSASPNYPEYPSGRGGGPGGGRGGAARGGFPGQVPNASDAQQAAIAAASGPLADLNAAATTASSELAAAAFGGSRSDIQTKADAVAAAELALALARANAVAALQGSGNRLNSEQLLALSGRAPAPAPQAAGRGGAGGGNNQQAEQLQAAFQEFLTPEALKNYDAIFLVSTTGVLPYPNVQALLDWVADGHAIMGLHAAMDTGESPDNYMEMLSGGARFTGHPGGGETARNIYVVNRNHPATRDWPDGLAVVDEFYQFRDFDTSKVNLLLEMDYEGTRLPVSWTRNYGSGRIFYTSMGHRDDVMLPNTPNQDYGGTQPTDQVPAAYQQHVLQGIRWALGLVN